MKQEIEEKNPVWLNKGSWYITAIFSQLYGNVFEYFIRNNMAAR